MPLRLRAVRVLREVTMGPSPNSDSSLRSRLISSSANVRITEDASQVQTDSRHLPQIWIRFLYSREPLLFVLSAISKLWWAASLTGLGQTFVSLSNKANTQETEMKLLLVYFAVGLSYVAAAICDNYFCSVLQSRVSCRLATLVSENATLRGSPEESQRSLAFQLASSDAHSVGQGALVVFDVLNTPIWFSAILIILFTQPETGWKYGLIMACMALGTLAWIYFLSLRLTDVQNEISAAEGKQMSTFVESLENMRTLRFYGWDIYMLQRLHKMTDDMLPLRSRLRVFKVVMPQFFLFCV